MVFRTIPPIAASGISKHSGTAGGVLRRSRIGRQELAKTEHLSPPLPPSHPVFLSSKKTGFGSMIVNKAFLQILLSPFLFFKFIF